MEEKPRELRECSVERTATILGDRWTLLILREAFFGVRYYDKFLANLSISTNILSVRLRNLVRHGILERQPDTQDARRFTYRLTERGLDLYPITLALMRWGDRWLAEDSGPPLTLTHRTCGQVLVPECRCAACGETIDPRHVAFN